MERYKKNWGTFITKEQQQELLKKHILVIGCGGNAEYILEYLARLGVRKITFFDGDIWEESNLNRQTFCTENTIGQYKVQGTLSRLKEINSQIEYQIYSEYFSETSLNYLENDIDCIIFAADANINIIECRAVCLQLLKKGVPVIDQSVHAQGCAVGIVTNKDLSLWYHSSKEWEHSAKIKLEISQPAYLCAMAASLTVTEMVKLFLYPKQAIIGQRLVYNVFDNKLHCWDEKEYEYIY